MTHKVKEVPKEKQKGLHITLDRTAILKNERPTVRLHPIFSNIFNTYFPQKGATK